MRKKPDAAATETNAGFTMVSSLDRGSGKGLMNKLVIKLKARGFFLADGRMLVTPSFDSVKEKPHFRLPGGQIEFGERSEAALAREMREEFAADVEVLELLDAVQHVGDGEPFGDFVTARFDIRQLAPAKKGFVNEAAAMDEDNFVSLPAP